MIEEIQKFLEENNLLNENSKLVVGYSGGFDSTALLYVLANLKKQFKFSLCAAHLNHGWREEADKEQETCKKFCNENNIEFYTEKLSPETPKTETSAREARYAFFERACKHFQTENLFTAHTKSDNAETILYRIAKGTGIKGLCGIEATTKRNGLKIFRPMMNISRAEIEAFCKENKLTPNNDQSNFDTKYKRNLIRHEVLPILQKINPNTENSLNSLSNIAKADEEIVNEYISKICSKIREENTFDTKNFIQLSPAVKQRIIYNFITEIGLEYDKKRINKLLNFIEQNAESKSGKLASLDNNLFLFCNRDTFYTVKPENEKTPPTKISSLKEEYKFGKYVFSFKKLNEFPKTFPKETDPSAIVNLPCQTGLELRYRQDGDKIQPFGMKETIKLKKYFINKGIPNLQKDRIVLLCNSEEVLWANGVGISEKLRAKNKETLYKIKIEEV